MTPPKTVTETETAQQPILRVLTPSATPEEIALIVALFHTLGGTAPATPKRRPVWSHPAHQMRGALRAGPGAWRTSGLPH